MTVVFSDLTTSDWAEFESHAPAACTWLLARAMEREYARLEALPVRTAWQERRLKELRARRLSPAGTPSTIGWMGTSGTDMETHDY